MSLTVTPNAAALPMGQQPGTGPSAESLGRFEDAMRRAFETEGSQPAMQLAQLDTTATPPGAAITDARPVQATDPAAPINPTRTADALDSTSPADRALRGLDLAPQADQGPGSSILNGLERLRGTFDDSLAAVKSHTDGTRMDVSTLVAIQTEVVQYSVLVDVSSKLAGKSTQALDSLMKGQ
ncbi:type III secretion system inner rod subunit SctI [Pseudooceanicola aestuarii]|uniref:type III secretion system inner rod subunit SctI n=1 Tax=Pseudooceanicola aestuarii TaxID=2697319 RepID=UPI0013D5AD4B|nr:type III secretion system inner rod subunit SctI [Pseudooceanicola aestuarii]